MKIIISPSKEQLEIPNNIKTTNPLFVKKAENLANKLKHLSVEEIKVAFNCSDKIAHEVKNSYSNFNQNKYPALFLFNGLQYKNIDVKSLNDNEITFLIENLYIVDSLYGILRGSDLISKYRLDYKTKLSFFDYSYYKNDINEILDEKIINLCSKEFSKCIDNEKLFTINFLQRVNGVVKSYSTHTKIARGKFVRYLASKNSTSFSTIRSFNYDNYHLIEESSSEISFLKEIT